MYLDMDTTGTSSGGRGKTLLTLEQRKSLTEAFDNGLNSTAKGKQTEISELAQRLGLECHTVKVSQQLILTHCYKRASLSIGMSVALHACMLIYYVQYCT